MSLLSRSMLLPVPSQTSGNPPRELVEPARRALRLRVGLVVVGELVARAPGGPSQLQRAALVAQRPVVALAHAVLLLRRLAAG
jgi:hypothetical protein